MTPQKFYDYITKHMSPEQALMKLLEGTVLTYEHLKFNTDDEKLHPTMVIALASLDMGWGLAIEDRDEEEIRGMIIGTDEYIESVLSNNNDLPEGEEN